MYRFVKGRVAADKRRPDSSAITLNYMLSRHDSAANHCRPSIRFTSAYRHVIAGEHHNRGYPPVNTPVDGAGSIGTKLSFGLRGTVSFP